MEGKIFVLLVLSNPYIRFVCYRSIIFITNEKSSGDMSR